MSNGYINRNTCQSEKRRDDIDTPGPFSLTDSEGETMKLMAKGFSSKRIAHKLCISEDMVEIHRKNILEKLAGNMNEAVTFAFSNKLR